MRHSVLGKMLTGYFVALLLVLTTCPVSLAGVKPLPIDFSPGVEPLEEGYVGPLEYKDDSIHVRIEEERVQETNIWVAYIKIAHPSQLRTISARGFDSISVTNGKAISRRANAVLAINGDYFSYENTGYLLRQGELYRNLPGGVRDVLLIDENGDFHIALSASEESLAKYDMKKMVNVFNFGPALVVDGKRVESFSDNRNAANLPRQRMCIAQLGPLEYMCIASAGPARGSDGMTMEQLSHVVFDRGAITAYNLDGGHSTMMFFKNEKINDVTNAGVRDISDMIYFASAYQEDK